MKDWLIFITEQSILLIDALALLMIVGGTIQAAAGGLHAMVSSPSGHLRRDVWLRYARWLIAGLTFQLGADVLETSINTDWRDIARVAAIAVIRTFLNFFLERDLTEVRERQREG